MLYERLNPEMKKTVDAYVDRLKILDWGRRYSREALASDLQREGYLALIDGRRSLAGHIAQAIPPNISTRHSPRNQACS